MSSLDELGDLPRELRISRAKSAPDVKRTRCLKQSSDNWDLREVIACSNAWELESKTRMCKAEKGSDEEIHVAPMTRSQNYEIVRANLTDRCTDFELIERDLRRRFSQCLANDIRKDTSGPV